MDPFPDGRCLELTEDELEELEQEALRFRSGLARWVYVKGVVDVDTGDYL